MKYCFAALLLLSAHNLRAQNTDVPGNEFHIQKPAYAQAEIGLSLGIYRDQPSPDQAFKLQYFDRGSDHFQFSIAVGFMQFDGINIGAGLGANFPLSSGRSYFYPGLEVSYYRTVGLLGSVHIGYTYRLSQLISLNLEPGYTFLRQNSPPYFDFSGHGGVRFNF
ncbi:MAG: hypothetical protein BGO70_00780 [Bacteroidetes bacterium 43-93]|nr:hypothetical protein [Bacteroidota bacterium]OJW96250.1 MAG: hypothetical protein BGO70_00780 [Bacteroidetes bacterium 43-93]